MAKRLGSVDLVLFGQQHTYDFSDEPVELDIELTGDELTDTIAAGNEVLRNVESLEVYLVDSKPASATVRVAFTYTYSSTVEVELDDLEGAGDEEDVQQLVESGYYAVTDAITEDIERYVDVSEASIDNIEVDLFDEYGNDFEA